MWQSSRLRSTCTFIKLFEKVGGRYVFVKNAVQIILMRLLLFGHPQILLRDLLVEFPDKINFVYLNVKKEERERTNPPKSRVLTISSDPIRARTSMRLEDAKSSNDPSLRSCSSHPA